MKIELQKITIRELTFDGNAKRRQYEKQKGICPICGKHFEIEEMEADHITLWSQDGRYIG